MERAEGWKERAHEKDKQILELKKEIDQSQREKRSVQERLSSIEGVLRMKEEHISKLEDEVRKVVS